MRKKSSELLGKKQRMRDSARFNRTEKKRDKDFSSYSKMKRVNNRSD